MVSTSSKQVKGQSKEKVGKGKRGGLMKEEAVETASVGKHVYLYYFRAVGLSVVGVSFMAQIVTQALQVYTNIWLSQWSDDANSYIPEIRDKYLTVYGVLGSVSAVFVVVSTLTFALGGLNAANHLHNRILNNVFVAPMSFFDTTPKGRILNRFAKDIDFVDLMIPSSFNSVTRLALGVLGTIAAISYASPFFLLFVIPLAAIYWYIQHIFVKTARQLKRLQSASRSPIYSHFSETLSGLPTIRAYNLEHRFMAENEEKLDFSQMSYQPNLVSNRWLSIRLEMLGNLIVLFAALFAVLGRDSLDPGVVGLSLTYASSVTNLLSFLIRQASQIETNMVSVERIKEYQDDIPAEAPYRMPEQDPPSDWIRHGSIKFSDYQTRYRDGLDIILKGISCEIQSSEKIGVVGRTGAGKSSLVLSLFRLIEAVSGSIEIDCANVALMGLEVLRSNLTIIPQDPVLFSGTLRFNLDPFDCYSDQEVWNALRLSHLHSFVSTLPHGLQFEVAEGGSNLSVGQKQLICLARALLRKTKILVLDEATAAIDLDTDNLIQQTIRSEFGDCTVLTIAHRLNTIMDSSRIMVLDQGKVAEFDTPENLLSDKDGLFYNMALNAGIIKA